MALPHAASGQLIPLRHAGEDLSRFSSTALAKTEEFELIRLVMPRGKSMPEHSVPGAVTLLCLEGQVSVNAHQRLQRLCAGEMMYLSGGQVHALHALQDALVLLTILLGPAPRR
jgi:quercetin dioxygenase-like cupin family protein